MLSLPYRYDIYKGIIGNVNYDIDACEDRLPGQAQVDSFFFFFSAFIFCKGM